MASKHIKTYNDQLNEKGLSRIYQHLIEHESVTITAFRNQYINCRSSSIDANKSEKSISLQENKFRNKELKASLLRLGYGVTDIDGTYIENFNTDHSIEVSEDSFFVVNLYDDISFLDNCKKLGEYYCQDAILWSPKGEDKAYLIGTNDSDFPGFDNQIYVGTFHAGRPAEFMSKVNNRYFSFSESNSIDSLLTTYQDYGISGKLAIANFADPVLEHCCIK